MAIHDPLPPLVSRCHFSHSCLKLFNFSNEEISQLPAPWEGDFRSTRCPPPQPHVHMLLLAPPAGKFVLLDQNTRDNPYRWLDHTASHTRDCNPWFVDHDFGPEVKEQNRVEACDRGSVSSHGCQEMRACVHEQRINKAWKQGIQGGPWSQYPSRGMPTVTALLSIGSSFWHFYYSPITVHAKHQVFKL